MFHIKRTIDIICRGVMFGEKENADSVTTIPINERRGLPKNS
jgi:hypothetical protein